MKRIFFDEWGFLRGRWMFALGLLALALFLVGINALMAHTCTETATIYQLEHRYSWDTGCNVLVDGEYRSIDNVRVVIDQ